MAYEFFPKKPDISPKIYAYEDTNPQYEGLLKIGFTAKDVRKRVAESIGFLEFLKINYLNYYGRI
ncbi:MAG: GIY-YIG nuclease family protein [Spirochaetes bacterium]|nr:GIY-YIG nuclease family protein [Spirochaetota bacterium]